MGDKYPTFLRATCDGLAVVDEPKFHLRNDALA